MAFRKTNKNKTCLDEVVTSNLYSKVEGDCLLDRNKVFGIDMNSHHNKKYETNACRL